jgi:hypothetical protein
MQLPKNDREWLAYYRTWRDDNAMGITALTRLFNMCDADHYDPDCISCHAAMLVREMRSALDECDREIHRLTLPRE